MNLTWRWSLRWTMPWRGRAAAALVVCVFVAGAAPCAATDLRVRGLLDLVATGRGSALDHNLLSRGDSPFDPYGMRVFGDAVVNDQLTILSQVVLRDASGLYVDGAYLMYSPSAKHDLHVLAGKIPWAIGTYGPRTYSNRNPLIGTPLMYQHQTSLGWYEYTPNADVLLRAAGSGPLGVNSLGYGEGPGMPIVDDSYWDVGVTVAGSDRPIEYALGVVAGTPGWGSTSRDENTGKSWLGRLGFAPVPWLRVGASGSYGPYLHASLDPVLPAGRTANDYHQKLLMADLELLVGHVELRAEGARNFWETPAVGELAVNSGYVEARVHLPVGAFLAGRTEGLLFGDITAGDGSRRSWDYNVRRTEGGIGYRFSREAVGKLVVQRTSLERPAVLGHSVMTMVAGQVSVGF